MNSLPESGAEPDEPTGSRSPRYVSSSSEVQPRNRPVSELDPGWILSREIGEEGHDPLASIAEIPWWTAFPSSPSTEAVQQLWRYTVSVSLAARWLAREAEDPSPDRVAAAALLHNLGLWAVTSVDPEWLSRWLTETDPERRLRRERDDLGLPLTDLGRRLAEKWGCPSLVVDAAWLHSPQDAALRPAAAEPDRIGLIQQAVRWARTTPWSIAIEPDGPRDRVWDHPSADPRLRILVAEVQSRCGTPFIAPDATIHEERMTRQNARLRLQFAEARRDSEASDRFLTAFSQSDPAERPEAWAQAAGLTWCAEPEVNTARVVWLDGDSTDHPTEETDDAVDSPIKTFNNPAPPTLTLPLRGRNRPLAEIQLWCDPSPVAASPRSLDTKIVQAWEAWATRVADRSRQDRRLRQILQGHREEATNQEIRVRQLKLDALAEFAAGAGHEINNPLAVVVGRSQLLLSRATDPEQARSLRIIMAQAQRAHRILRDLMFFARPPAPRLRPCRPADLLRSCVADFQDESAARGVELASEIDDPTVEIHADADALRHLAEILIRNAIQVTPSGGKVRVTADSGPQETRWLITDSGPGMTATEGAHLFDPFYCGRQAGRGLGLGLPRAARIVGLAGGKLKWSASPGHGSTFQVHLPRNPVPRPAKGDAATSTREVASDRPTILPIS